MYTDPVYFLNGLLYELGREQNAEDWSYDKVRAGEWFTANNPDTGELLQVYVEHVSSEACGTTGLTFTERQVLDMNDAGDRAAFQRRVDQIRK